MAIYNGSCCSLFRIIKFEGSHLLISFEIWWLSEGFSTFLLLTFHTNSKFMVVWDKNKSLYVSKYIPMMFTFTQIAVPRGTVLVYSPSVFKSSHRSCFS